MNIAITEGVDLMPPRFEDGLAVWSSEDGTPGSATYDGAGNAAIVPADQDFGGCLELLKTSSVQKLRWTGQTPILSGTYLRIRARVKAVSGILPGVRIAGYAADAGGNNLAALVQVGDTTTLTAYGEIVEISAIVGTGNRSGVDMVWGAQAVYGHFGLDLTGGSGGIVRIDDFVIEDVTEAFLRDMLDVVDVRDFGAVGDGVTDDRDAFQAADDAAEGRTVIVPDGTFLIGSHLTMQSKTRFEGTVTMAASVRLVLVRNLDLPTYIDAFGDEVLAFKKGFQALLHYADHDSFDMGGRRVEVSEPIDMQEALNYADTFEIRRVIRNGQFYVLDGPAWTPDVATSQGSYDPNNPYTITGLSNASQIQPGSVVAGTGVGREVYVKEVNVGAGNLTLSQPLYGPNSTQTYTFTRYKYVLDFLGFTKMSLMTIHSVEFQMNTYANGVLLPRDGNNFLIMDCFFIKPKHRGISSAGRGCQDLHIDRCQFLSSEQGLPATDRVSVAFNVNGNDAKIRDSRFQRMGLTGILNGSGHLVVGNHWFQGDEVTDGPRTAGMVFTYEPCVSVVTGNYIDNCSIEWTNEHDAKPDFGSEYSFGGLTITGNIFVASDVASYFNFIVVKPYGSGHSITGMHVNQNVFRSTQGAIDRVEAVDTSIAVLNPWSFRNITFERNTFHGVSQATISPVTLEFQENTNQTTWTMDVSGYLPFDGNARTVSSVVVDNGVQNAANDIVFDMPYVKTNQGAGNDMVQLVWPEPTRGTVHVTARVDKPY